MILSEKVDGLVPTPLKIVRGALGMTMVHKGSNRCRRTTGTLGTLVPDRWGWTGWCMGYCVGGYEGCCAVVLWYVGIWAGLPMSVSLWQVFWLVVVWRTLFLYRLERLYLLRKNGGEDLQNRDCSISGGCNMYHKGRGEPCKRPGLDQHAIVLMWCIICIIYHTSTVCVSNVSRTLGLAWVKTLVLGRVMEFGRNLTIHALVHIQRFWGWRGRVIRGWA